MPRHVDGDPLLLLPVIRVPHAKSPHPTGNPNPAGRLNTPAPYELLSIHSLPSEDDH